MQPLNRSERTKAYINFMLLFLLCTGIIVTTVFFSTRASVKQNELLIKDKNEMKESRKIMNDFAVQMERISNKIDSMDKVKEADFDLFNSDIVNAKNELDKMIPSDEGPERLLYKNVLKNLNYYQVSKQALRGKSESNSDQKELLDKIEKLNEKVDEYKEKLFECMTKAK